MTGEKIRDTKSDFVYFSMEHDFNALVSVDSLHVFHIDLKFDLPIMTRRRYKTLDFAYLWFYLLLRVWLVAVGGDKGCESSSSSDLSKELINSVCR